MMVMINAEGLFLRDIVTEINDRVSNLNGSMAIFGENTDLQ